MEEAVISELKQNPYSASSRLTIVEHISHETIDTPYQVPCQPYMRTLKSDDQAYSRILKVGKEWMPIDTGWLKDYENISLLYMQNLEGKSTYSHLTLSEEEKASIEERIVQIGVNYGGVSIVFGSLFPRESIRITPFDLPQYRIRCLKGIAKVQICLIPE